MKIIETYFVEEQGVFIKLHYCVTDCTIGYFKEYSNGIIQKINSKEFYKLLG